MNPLNTTIDLLGLWRLEIYFGAVFAILFFAFKFRRLFSTPVVLFLTYLYLRAFSLVDFPFPVDPDFSTAYQSTAAQCLIEAMIFPLFVWFFRPNPLKYLDFVALPVSFLLLFGVRGPHLAPSFDCAFLALAFPFLSIPVKILSVFTILTRHATTAQIMLLAYALLALRSHGKAILALSLSVVFVVMRIDFFSQGNLWEGNGRLAMWLRNLEPWSGSVKYVLFGRGPGSFVWDSLTRDGFRSPAWLQMHSDLLQTSYELGLIGLVLALYIWAKAFVLQKSNQNLQNAIAGMMIFSATYHPFRFLPSLLLCLFILKAALFENQIENTAPSSLPSKAS